MAIRMASQRCRLRRTRRSEIHPRRFRPIGACYAALVAIEVGSAVSAARGELVKILGVNPPGLRLEEVEYDDADNAWLITLGYLEEDVDPNPPIIEPIRPHKKYERVYKVFRIDASTGTFRSMKLRQA